LADSSGALVAGVSQGSSAERAGVKTGDIITSINGNPMKSAGELRNAIGMLRVGDKVDIGLLRDGKVLKVTALVAERAEAEPRMPRNSTRASRAWNWPMHLKQRASRCVPCRTAVPPRRQVSRRTT